MSETIMSNWSEDENQFASIIIKMIKDRHAKYEKEYREGKESKHVLLADMSLKSLDFSDYTIMMPGLSIVQEYNSNQDWNQNWKAIAERMLERFYQKGELKVCAESPVTYKFNTEGFLYGRLTEELASTQ